MKTIIKSAFVLLLVINVIACKKDKNTEPSSVTAPPPPANNEELITTMKVLLRDTATNTNYEYVFSDLDGPGGNPAIFGGINQSDSVITILSNHVYQVALLLIDQTKNPADTISNEVLEEGTDHLFFFNSTSPTGSPYSVYLPSSMTTIKYLDLDANNRGIGLSTLWIAPSMMMSKSPLLITLKHQPGVKDGTFAPGETDIQVTFKLKIN